MTKQAMVCGMARRSFSFFAMSVMPNLSLTPFHVAYYRTLQLFAIGRIRRLIVTMPPQHGKSQGSTRLLPAYMLGRNPDLRIAIASYADTFAKKFNRDIQRIIDNPTYYALFPDTTLNRSNVVTVSSSYLRNASEFEVVNHQGSLKAVGRGGGLTGNAVDVMILDDLYKDAMEGNSPTIREATWEWYSSVVRTRLHNDSQELIVFTRWHEDDLIGRLEQSERVVELTDIAEVETLDIDPATWVKVNFEAIKESEPTPIDPRPIGTPLWPARHNLDTLEAKRKLDGHTFECLYQGHPTAKEGLLYDAFRTYTTPPAESDVFRRMAYIDTADTGSDYLCAIAYNTTRSGEVYIVDVLYTQAAMEQTEKETANLLLRNKVAEVDVESNNGGRGFARAVQALVPRCNVRWFHQGGNKEARVISNAATVQQVLLFPHDWAYRWPTFYAHLTQFKRVFRANAHDDCADAVTGVVEMTEKNNGNYFIAYPRKTRR